MGSIFMVDVKAANCEENATVDKLPLGKAENASFSSFEIAALVSDQNSSTGLDEGVLLLSWLIVLLRTREGGEISFDWAYKGWTDSLKHEQAKGHLAMGNVMTGLQDNVGQVAAAIRRDIVASVASSQHTAIPGSVSLLLSTGSLSQTPQEVKEEVST